MEQAYNPIHLLCPTCGAPIRYEPASGVYHCANCGNDTAPGDQYKKTVRWRRIHPKDIIREGTTTAVFYHCPGCGADVAVDETEASGTCSFCGGSLVRREYTEKDAFPQLIIPFELKQEEAEAKLKEFCSAHLKGREKSNVKNSLSLLKGCYLPFRFVRGPVECEVVRDVSGSVYHARAYVDGLAVNTTAALSNEVLDACEPYDWEQIQEFSFGYIAGHPVRMEDVDDKAILARVWREVESDFIDDAMRVMQSRSVEVNAYGKEVEILPVLLPVYLITKDNMSVFINGQTGRTAVSFGRFYNRGMWWWVEPLLTAVIAGLIAYLIFPSIELAFMFFAAAGLIAWTAFDNLRSRHDQLIVRHEPQVKDEIGKAAPVFHETVGGRDVNVEIRFFPARRVIKMILLTVLCNILPLLLAMFFAFSSGKPLSDLNLSAMFLWLVISVPVTFIYWIAYVRRDVYDDPVLREILEDGSLKKIPRKKKRVWSFKDLRYSFDGWESILFLCLLLGLPAILFIMSIVLMLE